MKNIINASQRRINTLAITNITQIKFELGMTVSLTHVILFFLISTKYPHFRYLSLKKPFQHSVSK